MEENAAPDAPHLAEREPWTGSSEPAGSGGPSAPGPPRPPAPYIDLWGWKPGTVFGVWFLVSSVLLAAGIALNWWLTDGTWVIPRESFGGGANPFGEDTFRGLTSHPYDVLTAVLYVGSVALIGLSLLLRDPTARHLVRGAGWVVFAFHWGATAMNFYYIEEGDVVNAGFAMVAVFLLVYFAYHELVSLRLRQDYPSLRFAAGAVFVASTVWYFFLKFEPATRWIIETVASQTLWMLQLFGQAVTLDADDRTGYLSAITYPDGLARTVIIILACTAIQSMMIFVAAAVAVQREPGKDRVAVLRSLSMTLTQRRWLTVLVTVPIVYLLNLLRNTVIVWWWATGWAESKWTLSSDQAFSIAHNYIGKGGSLVALVVIAFLVFRILPELYESILGLFDLPKKRRGPLERFVVPVPKVRKRKAPAPAAAGPPGEP